MKNPNKPSPAHNLLKQLLTLFPNTPTLTLAKKAYNLHRRCASILLIYTHL